MALAVADADCTDAVGRADRRMGWMAVLVSVNGLTDTAAAIYVYTLVPGVQLRRRCVIDGP